MPLKLAKNIQSNFSESFEFGQERKKRQVNQIVLLNNLQRGDENIASTLLITLFNRILSNTYDNKLGVKFIPGEEMEQKKVNAINILAQNDYREMDKDKLDYDWNWDTLFFGNGFMETLNFDKKRKILKPHVINPLVFGYDPFFDEVDDWRYYWKWKTLNRWQIWSLIQKGVIKGITDPKELPSGVDPYLWDYKVTREQAKKATPQASDTQNGDVFQILEFFGYADEDDATLGIKRGDKCVFWTDRDISKIIFTEKLDLKDGPDNTSNWPLVRKYAFKEPHSTVNFSVADILEDKQRARNVLLNLAFIAAKDKANPIYKYVPENVVDVSQLFSRQINQHIPVKDLQSAIEPLATQNPMDNGLMAFMQTLSQEANDPMGTGMSLNPSKKGKQSATDAAIQQQLNDLAQSLQSKVMQFGEEEFWSDWYQRYRVNSKAGDMKIASIVGTKGVTFENIDLGDFQTKYPPGVLISSTKDAEYKELVLRRDLTQLRGDFANTWTPDAVRAFDKHVLLPKYLQDPNLVEVLLPRTLDEINAEAENEMFVKSLPPVKDTDNHEQHLAVHYLAPNSWAKWIHIEWHQELLGLQKKQQQEAQQQPQEGNGPPPKEGGGENNKGGKPQFNNQQKDPKEAASPLKTEFNAQQK